MNRFLKDPRRQVADYPKIKDGSAVYSIGAQYNDIIKFEVWGGSPDVGFVIFPGYNVQACCGELNFVNKNVGDCIILDGKNDEHQQYLAKLGLHLYHDGINDYLNQGSETDFDYTPQVKCWRVLSQQVRFSSSSSTEQVLWEAIRVDSRRYQNLYWQHRQEGARKQVYPVPTFFFKSDWINDPTYSNGELKELTSSYFQLNLQDTQWPWNCFCGLPLCSAGDGDAPEGSGQNTGTGDDTYDNDDTDGGGLGNLPVIFHDADSDSDDDIGETDNPGTSYDPNNPVWVHPDDRPTSGNDTVVDPGGGTTEVPGTGEEPEDPDDKPTDGDGSNSGSGGNPPTGTEPEYIPVFPPRPNDQVYSKEPEDKPPKLPDIPPDDDPTQTEPPLDSIVTNPNSLHSQLEDEDIEVTQYDDVGTIENPDPNVIEPDTHNPNGHPLDNDGNEDLTGCTTKPNQKPLQRPEPVYHTDPLGDLIAAMQPEVDRINQWRREQDPPAPDLEVDWRLVEQGDHQTDWIIENMWDANGVQQITPSITGGQWHPIETKDGRVYRNADGEESRLFNDRARNNSKIPDGAVELYSSGNMTQGVDFWTDTEHADTHGRFLKDPNYTRIGFTWKSLQGVPGFAGGISYAWLSKGRDYIPDRTWDTNRQPELQIGPTAVNIKKYKLNSPYLCGDPAEEYRDENMKLPEKWYEFSVDDMAAMDEYLRNYQPSIEMYDGYMTPPDPSYTDAPHLSKNGSLWPNPRNIPVPSLSTAYHYDNYTCSKYVRFHDSDKPTSETTWDYGDSPPQEYDDPIETDEERKKRYAQEQQFLSIYDSKYGMLKKAPTLPVWVDIKKWQTLNLLERGGEDLQIDTSSYKDFGIMIYELAFTLDLRDIKDPFGSSFERPQDFILFNYYLFHRQQTPVEAVPRDQNGEAIRSQIPGHKLNFQPNTGKNWSTVQDFADPEAVFPFPYGILDDRDPLEQWERMYQTHQNRNALTVETPDFDKDQFSNYIFNNDFPKVVGLPRKPPDDFFTFYPFHPYEYLREYAFANHSKWEISPLAYTLELFERYHELTDRKFIFPDDFPSINGSDHLPVNIDSYIDTYMETHMLDPLYESVRSMKLYIGLAYYKVLTLTPFRGDLTVYPGMFPKVSLTSPLYTESPASDLFSPKDTDFWRKDSFEELGPGIPKDIVVWRNTRVLTWYALHNSVDIWYYVNWVMRDNPKRYILDHLTYDIPGYNYLNWGTYWNAAGFEEIWMTLEDPFQESGVLFDEYNHAYDFLAWRFQVRHGVAKDDYWDGYDVDNYVANPYTPDPATYVNTRNTFTDPPISRLYPDNTILADVNQMRYQWERCVNQEYFDYDYYKFLDYQLGWSYRNYEIDLKGATTPSEAVSLVTEIHPSRPMSSIPLEERYNFFVWYMNNRNDIYEPYPAEGIQVTATTQWPTEEKTFDQYMSQMRLNENDDFDFFYGRRDPEVTNEMVFVTQVWSKREPIFESVEHLDSVIFPDDFRFTDLWHHTYKLAKYFYERCLVVALKKTDDLGEVVSEELTANPNASSVLMGELKVCKGWICHDSIMIQMVEFINLERDALSIPRLEMHAYLVNVGQRHVNDMLRRAYVSLTAPEGHPNGATTADRLVSGAWNDTTHHSEIVYQCTNADVGQHWTEFKSYWESTPSELAKLMDPNMKYIGYGYNAATYLPDVEVGPTTHSLVVAGPIVDIENFGIRYLNNTEYDYPPYCIPPEVVTRTVYPTHPMIWQYKSNKSDESEAMITDNDIRENGIIKVTTNKPCNQGTHEAMLYPAKDTILIRFRTTPGTRITLQAECVTNREYQLVEGTYIGKFETYNKGANPNRVARGRVAVRRDPALPAATKLRRKRSLEIAH
jgi:uncharacterized protein YkwD